MQSEIFYCMLQKGRSFSQDGGLGFLCLSSVSLVLLINRCIKRWVKACRGLRQVDLLSPFFLPLWLMFLSRLMLKAMKYDILDSFLVVGNGREKVSHLQFIDDIIFFLKSKQDDLQNLRIILMAFECISGLKTNISKTTFLGTNTHQNQVLALTSLLDCRVFHWPISYCFQGGWVGGCGGGTAKKCLFFGNWQQRGFHIALMNARKHIYSLEVGIQD